MSEDMEHYGDPPCTDCGNTGITYQTERSCTCAAGMLLERAEGSKTMPDLKADAATARIDAANLQAFGAHDVTAILRLADMADRLADTEGLSCAISCANVGPFNSERAAQAVQDYATR